MRVSRLLAVSLLVLLGASLAVAQAPFQEESEFSIPGTETLVRIGSSGGEPAARVSRDGGATFEALLPPETRLMFQYAQFDPTVRVPDVPGMLRADSRNRLFVVQFHTQILREFRQGLTALGAEIHTYLAHQAYLVRMDPSLKSRIESLPYVRFVGRFHQAYKLEPVIIDRLLSAEGLPPARYNLVMVDKTRDEFALADAVSRAGGTVVNLAHGGILIEAQLTDNQLLQVAAQDTLMWIDRWGPGEEDIDQARIQGGADYLEPQKALRYTGKGVNGMIMEGVYRNHPEFAATPPYRIIPIIINDGTGASHGNSTCGEIFAKGASPLYRGLCPDGQAMYCNYNYVINTNRRYATTQTAINQHDCMFQTASWGYPRTSQYNSRSAEMDDIIFDLDIAITQSQSNARNSTASRPQAWAKNIIATGGINHQDTANPADDRYSSGSTGPASDGRVKPDMVAYYDRIRTTSGSTTYTTSFGGTSGATPIVAGHVGLIYEMFTTPSSTNPLVGIFGNPLRPQSSWQNRFANKPHFSTAKGLLINGAVPYPNNNTVTTRWKQGWGFPSVRNLYDDRNQLIAVDEYDVLLNRQSKSYWVFAPGGEMRVTMTYADPENSPVTKQPHRMNDLTLQVNGPQAWYWGNNGLNTTNSSNWSSPGGSANTIDTVENVFIQNAPRGFYEVRVVASNLVVDGHVQTRAVDADFALIVNGIKNRDRSGMVLDLTSSAPGNLVLSLTGLPAGWTAGQVVYALDTTRPQGYGYLFGLEADTLTILTYLQPPLAGSPFHFTNVGGAVFPNVPYTFAPGIANALTGITVDAVAFATRGATYLDFSNVTRVTVR